ncbi:ABC-2 type transport system ATP-binding protein [Diaminobutyricimonas aerilata]|uniref:ABC-2 type transport system ATP-binding protein n=1 Tax=Diaminobutyricimonas aerilata TaxID=1162967 RepID=A0A2M9CFD9_9MICO|nr:ATP-binding cassette domain-containing protein [Diaminobutyricimonas aerilata]PJJ70623.1 ABC-2 type transport system ATP-binding protein [Diaminobutyricimonas aerilata]
MTSTSTQAAIVADGVVKRYPSAAPDDPPALDGFDLEVPHGTVHGLLGPNGAGKTTAVRVMTSLLAADSGTVRVAGHDVAREGAEVRRRIGLVGQYAALDEQLTGRQNLVLFGRLSRLSPADSRRRADEMLERFALADTGRKPVSAYSGGMRRRLDLAVSLLVAPQVLFVDEPTTGLDPGGRREVWDAVRTLVAGGTTVLLTTQYLEEADQLADRISLVAHGRVVAAGTPGELKKRVGDDTLELVPQDPAEIPAVTRHAERWATGPVRSADGRVHVPVADRGEAVLGLAAVLADSRIRVADLAIRTPTLDDVFLSLTGTTATSNPTTRTEGVPA